MGYNTTLGYLETWSGTSWVQASIPTTGLGVASGGTGQTTLTANNVLLGNGTTAVAFVAPGTSGNILKSDGTTWTSAAAAAGGFSNMTVYTSPGTFTTPATVTQIKVTVVGGGGNGGAGAQSPVASSRGGGGGGGGAAIYVGSVTASTPYAVTVGPTSGGTSSFTTLASATGGSNGSVAASGTTGGTGGAGGAGTAGTLLFTGSYGVDGGASPNTASVPTNTGSSGGSSFLGGGAKTRTSGQNYGGGAGGGVPGDSTTIGAGGVVIVEY
jgi:hypothetical protein